MSNEGLKGWLIAVSILAGYCALGWYNVSNNSESSSDMQSNSTSVDYENYSSSDYEDKISEYENALYDANTIISDANSCTDDAYGAFDSGDFEEGIYQLDNCRFDEVSEPSSL